MPFSSLLFLVMQYLIMISVQANVGSTDLKVKHLQLFPGCKQTMVNTKRKLFGDIIMFPSINYRHLHIPFLKNKKKVNHY